MTSRIICADVLDGLASLADESVQCCITSPPYWGLRDYGTAQWDGGKASCDHNQARRAHSSDKQETSAGTSRDTFAGLGVCRKCGARRIDQQIGLERTPEEYVARIVAVFREVRRVLRNEGTLWLNLGDSYCSTAPGTMGDSLRQTGILSGVLDATADARRKFRNPTPNGLKPKDLVGIPWRVAFALQADGWYLRSDIIWHKPNPMPESVTDRPTKAHEYLFLLAKSGRYFYDAEAIKEPASADTHARYARGRSDAHKWADGGPGNQTIAKSFEHMRKLAPNGSGIKNNASFDAAMAVMPEFRNRRSVWTIATQPFKGAHFATFPEKLVEPCVLAGSRPGDTILDSCAGSGTVGVVARKLGRDFIGIELNPTYAQMARERIGIDESIAA